MRKILLLLVALFVAGALFTVSAVQAEDAKACDFDDLAGQPYAAELFLDVGERPIRVLTPETEISMEDHVAGRINVLVEGESQIIIAVACE